MNARAVPMFRVTNAAAAEAHYCAGLGFRIEFRYRADPAAPDPAYLSLMRDGAAIHVSSFGGDGVPGALAYVYVDDVGALDAEFRARGVRIDAGPLDQPWGMREIYVRDADGNCLRFGQRIAAS
jgi:catechol 2,3-dioxygenase-like lactoylglutathione lyase family enzyme